MFESVSLDFLPPTFRMAEYNGDSSNADSRRNYKKFTPGDRKSDRSNPKTNSGNTNTPSTPSSSNKSSSGNPPPSRMLFVILMIYTVQATRSITVLTLDARLGEI